MLTRGQGSAFRAVLSGTRGGNVRFRTSELEAPLASNRPKATSSNQILISNKGDDVIFRIIVIITFKKANSLKGKK